MAAFSPVAIGRQHGVKSPATATVTPAAPARTQPDESVSKSLKGCLALGSVAAANRKRYATVRRDGPLEQTTAINYYKLDAMKASAIRKKSEAMLDEGAAVLQGCEEESAQQKMFLLLSSPAVNELLTTMSRLSVFSHEFGLAFKDGLGCSGGSLIHWSLVGRSHFALSIEAAEVFLEPLAESRDDSA